MKALNERRAGRCQPGKIDQSPAVNDSAATEPNDPASAEALAARDPKTGTGSESSRCLSQFSGRDRTGWPPHPSERRDFYHRIRVFPPEVAGWRKRMAREVAADSGRFPRAAGATPDEIQPRFDDGISYLREVARILAVL